jgi:DNA-binding CsgD family transcriptional regulator
VVLGRLLSNPSPTPLTRAIRAYRKLDLSKPARKQVRRILPKRAKHLTARQLAVLVQGYQAGATVYELAERFGIDRKIVALQLKRQGVTMRLQSPSEAQIGEMVRLYGTGLSLVAVGERVGVDGRTVHRYLRRWGVPMGDAHGRERP